MYQTIKTEISERIMTITINRPERMNVYNTQMKDELISALDAADRDDEVKVIIVTGEGRAFCAGKDLEQSSTHEIEDIPMEDFRDTGGLLSLRIYEMKKPMIAAINGAAVGIGITMTLPMDIRIASTNAKMGFVFTRRGISPEACSGWFLPRIVGLSKAMEWMLSGRLLSATEALEGGLVSRVVPPEELLPTARTLALEIANHTSSVSVALVRQLLLTMLGADHPMESHKLESKMVYWTRKQADAQEGILSFFEKRNPNFSMKVSSDMPPFYPFAKERKFKE